MLIKGLPIVLLALVLAVPGGLATAQPPNMTPEEQDVWKKMRPEEHTDWNRWCKAKPIKRGCECDTVDLDQHGYGHFRNPVEIRSKNGRLRTALTLKYAQNKIAGCNTNLRSYNGRLVGPTLRLKPGETLNVTLRNQLPPNRTSTSTDPNDPRNNPSLYNTTNFHSHGLHVSPAGNSDNVLIQVKPGTEYEIEIDVPEDHPPGTFWYHPHIHGSTAIQVSSGVVGALIIEGGLDEVPEIAEAEDRILVFEQITYDSRGALENYYALNRFQWIPSRRLTLVNGQVVPTIYMRPGEVQRWRMIHAGMRETLNVALVNLATQGANAVITQKYTLHEIAVDGLALGRMVPWDTVAMFPGYRRDVLVKAPHVRRPTTLYLMDLGEEKEKTLHGVREPRKMLARVVVEGPPIDMALPSSQKLASLKPHRDITASELNGEEQMVNFNVDFMLCPSDDPNIQNPGACTKCEPGSSATCKMRFMSNDYVFTTKRPHRKLVLGTVAKWKVKSSWVSHPFHIHTNPFQHTRMEPDGNGGEVERTVWRDTLMIHGPEPGSPGNFPPEELLTRYERYIGQFVFHCHILDHEDRGMMELLEIVTPGSENGHH